jgi:hypothetical protein
MGRDWFVEVFNKQSSVAIPVISCVVAGSIGLKVLFRRNDTDLAFRKK